MSYIDDVRTAANALQGAERADWLVAELTYKNTHRSRQDGNRLKVDTVTMEKWCADLQANAPSVRLRFGPATGYRYAKIWGLYGVQFAQAKIEMNFKDAYTEVGGIPDRERMMEYEHIRLINEGTPEQKVRAATALMQDADVVEAATDPETPMSEAVENLTEEVTKVRMEQALAEADEPTISVQEMEDRIKEGKKNSVPYQYTRFAVVLSGYFLQYTPEQVADAILGDRYSMKTDTYVQQAERAIAWFSAFRSALKDGQRPRLVPVAVEDAS